ncbi:hypothetical protein A0123_03417 [Gluconobacter cerinus]|uniref:Uncharacterized protein n=1 Tax=Gluconobacter cerinus TaxID=38307 RepID=A0A1B6VFB8_9PROT|nr:hypothetical protein A0123_03417 [Gluconobacter cerinus]
MTGATRAGTIWHRSRWALSDPLSALFSPVTFSVLPGQAHSLHDSFGLQVERVGHGQTFLSPVVRQQAVGFPGKDLEGRRFVRRRLDCRRNRE